ncbi:MAG TPA: hypothetical protein VER96_35560 [Polyangiaceae bacterium]|nr:hypothetical protein [Polyangiaceae bacterium]
MQRSGLIISAFLYAAAAQQRYVGRTRAAMVDPYTPPRHTAADASAVNASGVATELQYFPTDDRRSSSAGIGIVFVLPLAVYAGVQAVTDSILLGVVAGGVSVAWPVIRWRLAKTRPRATLRVENGSLHLSGPAFSMPRSIALPDLLDVYLDTKAIQRLREAPSPIPDLRFLNQTVGAQQDVTRIALELRDETLFLTEERGSHSETNEWFSKIRRFLRRHGWVPADERP